jgi:Cof subfamily protein (haloacid dehalogenase superfamily)
MDGTLLDPQGRITPAAGRILRELSTRGVRVVLASGRMTERIIPFAEELAIPASVIAYNGAEVWEKKDGAWRVAHASRISSRTREEVFSLCRRRGIFLNVYSGGKLHGYHPSGDFAWSAHYEKYTEAVYASKCVRLEDLPVGSIAKLLIIESPENRDKLYDELAPAFGGHCRVLKSNPEYLEFVDGNTSKASALEFWMRAHGISRQELLAFGDAENDFEMLNMAGLGVAMGNCTPGLRALYPRVSEWTHDQDGVARALARLFPD